MHLFDEIREVGYHHGTTFFSGLRKASTVTRKTTMNPAHFQPGSSPPWFPAGGHAHYAQWERHRNRLHERRQSGNYTFTDLAQIVVGNIQENKRKSSESTNSSRGRGRLRPSRITRGAPEFYGLVARPPLDFDMDDEDGSDDTGIQL